MQAIVNSMYGGPDSLRLAEIDRPGVDADGVLIRVHAASLNPLDWHELRGEPYFARLFFGLRRPKRSGRGHDVAGTVEAVGRNVTEFHPGDEVFGTCHGAFADYACGTAEAFVAKPARLSFEEAAALPVAGVTALQGLRDHGAIQPGQRVLVNGAAGGVGTFAVQLAKSFSADVTGVCSDGNVELVRSIGADRVLDYATADFTRSAERYDLILDTVGNHSLRALRRATTPTGTVVLIGGGSGRILGGLGGFVTAKIVDRFVSQALRRMIASVGKEDLVALKQLVDDGKVTPVIDRAYPLSDTAEAIRYLETKHARGKIVITV